jgi:4-amino-4-deoxy-L-arabinose transferase-like glycosyltransferase
MLKDAALFLAGATLWFVGRRKDARAPNEVNEPSIPRGWLVLLIVLAACAALTFALHLARMPDGDWDAWAIWNVRARFMFRGSSATLTFDPALSHADYPPLLPAIIAQGWLILGRETLLVPAIVAVAFATLTVGVLGGCVAALCGRVPGMLAAAVLLGTPHFLHVAEEQIADVPLACAVLTGLGLLAVATERGKEQSNAIAILAGVALSGASLIKNEGLLYLACALVAMTATSRRRLIVWIIFGALPGLMLLGWFKIRYAPANDLTAGLSAANVRERLLDANRHLFVLRSAVIWLVQLDKWNVFLPAALLILLASFRKRWNDSCRVLGLALVLLAGGFEVVYVLTPHDLRWHVSSSMDRLIVQMWPTLILLTALLAFTPGRSAKGQSAVVLEEVRTHQPTSPSRGSLPG